MTRFNDFHTANRFTSACSAIVYRDRFLFGTTAEANDRTNEVSHTFVSEPVHNLVHHEVMKADGISFTSQRAVGEEQTEFVSSTDNWFRPTMVRTGPDGALWIADMYRLVIEHPQWIPIEWQRKLNVRAGEDQGRIWRVFPLGSKLRSVPRFDRMSSVELVKELDSANGWQRDLVQRQLIDLADPDSIEPLRKQARQNQNPLCRLHSLCTLDGLNGGLHVPLLGEALSDPHPAVRRHAVRLLESFADVRKVARRKSPSAGPGRGDKPYENDIVNRLAPLVDDRDAQVRLQLAYSLGEFRLPLVGQLLGRLARKAEGDPYMLAAVLSSLSRDNLADVLAEVVKDGAVSTELLEQLLGQATAFEHEPALVSLLMRATEPSGQGGLAAWQFSAVQQFLVALSRRGESFDQWLKKLGNDAGPIDSRMKSVFATARSLAANPDSAVDLRVAAVRVLGQSDGDLSILSEVLTPQQSPELQAAALESMARLKSAEVAKILLANPRSLVPSLRTQAFSILMSRDAWREELLLALESKQLAAADLDATSRQRLLVHKTQAIRDRAAKLLAVDLNTDRVKLVGEYLPIVRAGGDAQFGSQIFAKRCAQCHKLGDIGHAVGPDLVSLTDKSAEALVTAILDPNRAVEAKFLTFTAVTKGGVTHNGILASETASSLTLRAAEGKEVTLLRSEIDELQSSTKSLMPEGLERELRPDDAAALIAYVRRNIPLPAMKKFPNNAPKVIEADSSGALRLTPFDAEIYGPTIVIEEQHQNLGWWSSADDIVVWTTNVPVPGLYSVEWTWACEAQAAGNGVVVEALGKSITSRVSKTAGWDDYQTAKLGELELPKGEVRLTMKPASRPLPALGDVKSVVLRLMR
jgi:putative heme-binding domain-containing protein